MIGQLTLWDLTDWYNQRSICQRTFSDDENDDAEENPHLDKKPNWNNLAQDEYFCRFSLHKDTISQIIFPRNSLGRELITSSYDGSIRLMNLESNQVYSLHRLSDRNAIITSMDYCPSSHLLWYSTSDGDIEALDYRCSMKAIQSLSKDSSEKLDNALTHSFSQVFEKKCGCVSVHPTLSHLLLATSNDKSMRIFDIRGGAKSDEVLSSLYTHQHGFSCTSAYWRPVNGNGIVSTSYDDTIRIWNEVPTNIEKLKDPKILRHDNRTGKWVTIFRYIFFIDLSCCFLG